NQCAKIFKTVRCDQACGSKLPQSVFDLARQQSSCSRQVRQERSTTPSQAFENVACRLRNAVGLRKCIEKPWCVFTQKDCDRRYASRPDSAAARSCIIEHQRRMRREPAPHDLTGEAKPIEQIRCISNDAASQDF